MILYFKVFGKEEILARVPITVMGYRCERCGHEWIPQKSDEEPWVCPNPKCHSVRWDRPKGEKMSYELFRSKIQKEINDAGGSSTWTEIRTAAKLPQKFPNNQWVHK